jgi:maltooligosyltrehalose trehalohydrolase
MDAQWIDEFHHALRVTAGGEKTGYYADFNGIEHLAKSYRDAYVYDGQWSPHRNKKFGVRAEGKEGQQFIVFSQNHDQVGNRMLGERTSVLASFEMQKLMAAAVLISPYLPMLFMGEEWSAPDPFLYFVSHTDKALAEAVRKGRKEEFAAFHAQGEAPDPVAEETFLQSKLKWHLLDREPHATMLRYYKALVQLRKTHPALANLDRKHLHVECNKDNNTLFLHRWHEDQHIVCGLNFSKKEQYMPPPSYAPGWHRVFDSSEAQWQGPGSRAAAQVAGSRPGATTIVLQPESIVIYKSSHPPTGNR